MTIDRMQCLAAMLFSLLLLGCSPPCTNEVAQETLWTANRHGFDYCGIMQKAMRGDSAAFWELVDFDQHTDAASGLGHSAVVKRVVVEFGDGRAVALIPGASDERTRTLARLLDIGFAYDPDGDWRTELPMTNAALSKWLPNEQQ